MQPIHAACNPPSQPLDTDKTAPYMQCLDRLTVAVHDDLHRLQRNPQTHPIQAALVHCATHNRLTTLEFKRAAAPQWSPLRLAIEQGLCEHRLQHLQDCLAGLPSAWGCGRAAT